MRVFNNLHIGNPVCVLRKEGQREELELIGGPYYGELSLPWIIVKEGKYAVHAQWNEQTLTWIERS